MKDPKTKDHKKIGDHFEKLTKKLDKGFKAKSKLTSKRASKIPGFTYWFQPK